MRLLKKGFNWHIIDFIYELGAIKYLIDHNEILNDPDDESLHDSQNKIFKSIR